jgi:hypothetical protein
METNEVTSDGVGNPTGKSVDQATLHDYFSQLGKKSHLKKVEKYGKGYYTALINKRWKEYRRVKGEDDEGLEIILK